MFACLLVAGGCSREVSMVKILTPVTLKGGPEKRQRAPVAEAIAVKIGSLFASRLIEWKKD
jgi:hypothetical protein